jgi:undecaprenyl diphosphate synthase
MGKTQDKFPNLPQHVAIIMDGNGRWAEEQGLPRPLGHQAGAETVRRIVTHTRKLGIPHLTLYAFSTENWSRPQPEVDALMALLAAFLESELPTMMDNNVKLRIIGDMTRLGDELRDRLDKTLAATAGNSALTLTLAINYGGRDEIARAARKAMLRILENGDARERLDADMIAAHLDTAGQPDPDLVIRTAGEMRLSNFLVWQSAYAELLFTPRRWPEFSETDYEAALGEYARRVRKFGGI